MFLTVTLFCVFTTHAHVYSTVVVVAARNREYNGLFCFLEKNHTKGTANSVKQDRAVKLRFIFMELLQLYY